MKLWAEFLLLYFGLVGGYALIGSPGSPIPLLLLLGLGAFLYLRRRPDFDNATFTRRGPLKHILIRWAIAAVLLLAAAFGFAHIIYGSVVAVALTVIAGWIFAMTYLKSRSLLVTSIEHALYGVLAFTIGLGDIFYHGTLDR